MTGDGNDGDCVQAARARCQIGGERVGVEQEGEQPGGQGAQGHEQQSGEQQLGNGAKCVQEYPPGEAQADMPTQNGISNARYLLFRLYARYKRIFFLRLPLYRRKLFCTDNTWLHI